MTPTDDNFVSFERKKEKSCDMKIKESVLTSIFKNNLKYLIFLVLSILLLRYFPQDRMLRMEITSLVLVLTGAFILLDNVYPSKVITC